MATANDWSTLEKALLRALERPVLQPMVQSCLDLLPELHGNRVLDAAEKGVSLGCIRFGVTGSSRWVLLKPLDRGLFSVHVMDADLTELTSETVPASNVAQAAANAVTGIDESVSSADFKR